MTKISTRPEIIIYYKPARYFSSEKVATITVWKSARYFLSGKVAIANKTNVLFYRKYRLILIYKEKLIGYSYRYKFG